LYDSVRDWLGGYRVAAGLLTGAFGILVANPTDVVKIRL